MLPHSKYRAVFFDLDGTLVDTAPDMVNVLRGLQQDMGVEPIEYAVGRSNVSNGALGLLRAAFPDEEHEVNGPLMCEFINRYASSVCDRSALFDGLGELLLRLDKGSRPWGVVTNKPSHLTNPILEALGLAERSACTVSGDTLKTRKPHPAPLLHACELAGVKPAETLYVGDAARDIEAGQRAGLATIAAAYGYITADDDPQRWGADQIVGDAAELAHIVLKAVNLAS